MSLKERVYSVLIVSAMQNFNKDFSAMLPEAHYSPVKIVSNIASAKREYAEHSYDFVIINAPLPDEFGTRFGVDLCSSQDTIALILTPSDVHDEIYAKVSPYGLFTLPRPITKTVVTNALRWMTSARERLRKTEKKTLSMQEKMEEIRIINHAKWLLISEIKMSEPEAHKYLEKQSMDRCVSKREVAEEIIKTYS